MSTSSLSSLLFAQLLQAHSGPQSIPRAKQTQYCFRQREFLQLHC